MDDSQKVQVYEQLLHQIQLNAEVSLNSERLNQLIANICRWSYAHRFGNGMLSEEKQQEIIDHAFERLLK